MKLSNPEFRAMQSLPRKWGQKHFEIPMFRRMGLDVRNKDILEKDDGNASGSAGAGHPNQTVDSAVDDVSC
jgi:hypothetical protein